MDVLTGDLIEKLASYAAEAEINFIKGKAERKARAIARLTQDYAKMLVEQVELRQNPSFFDELNSDKPLQIYARIVSNYIVQTENGETNIDWVKLEQDMSLFGKFAVSVAASRPNTTINLELADNNNHKLLADAVEELDMQISTELTQKKLEDVEVNVVMITPKPQIKLEELPELSSVQPIANFGADSADLSAINSHTNTNVDFGFEPRQRENPVLTGMTYKVKTNQGALYVTINKDSTGIFEVFLNLGKNGTEIAAFAEALGRMVTLSLRVGVKPSTIVDQLLGINNGQPIESGNMTVRSIPDGVAQVMQDYLENYYNQSKI